MHSLNHRFRKILIGDKRSECMFAWVQMASSLAGAGLQENFVFGKLKMHNFKPIFILKSHKIHHKLKKKNG